MPSRLPRPPGIVLRGSIAAVLLLSSALSFLGWTFVRQERRLAVLRLAERAENSATLAVAALDKHLSDTSA